MDLRFPAWQKARKEVGGVLAMKVLLAECGSKADADEKNFGAAVGQYLDKKGEKRNALEEIHG
jgi:hypothetical protein